MNAVIPILDLTPIGRYADGSPRYRFSTSFPTSGVRAVGPAQPTPEHAYRVGKAILAAYEARDPLGNMGEVLGVVSVRTDGWAISPEGAAFRGVVNLYHSNT